VWRQSWTVETTHISRGHIHTDKWVRTGEDTSWQFLMDEWTQNICSNLFNNVKTAFTFWAHFLSPVYWLVSKWCVIHRSFKAIVIIGSGEALSHSVPGHHQIQCWHIMIPTSKYSINTYSGAVWNLWAVDRKETQISEHLN